MWRESRMKADSKCEAFKFCMNGRNSTYTVINVLERDLRKVLPVELQQRLFLILHRDR